MSVVLDMPDLRIACHTRSAVSGIAMSVTPRGRSASSTALTIAVGAPINPASPQPLAPSGLWVQGWQTILEDADERPDAIRLCANEVVGLAGRSQCLDRRIATRDQLVSEIAVWQRQRNASATRIQWMFTTEKARAKMGRAYPGPVGAQALSVKES